MSTSLRVANLTVALLFFLTAACTISTADRVSLPLALILWIAALSQILIGVHPLRVAVSGGPTSAS